MHFSPNRNDKVPNDGTMLLTLNELVIKRDKETKFLGVIIDENLKWDVHTKYLNSKLKSEMGKLNRIKIVFQKLHTRNFITHYLNLIDLSYGISAWGGISFKKLEPLFIAQKKCLRIMFGDNEAYHNKFKTAARV